MKYKKNPLKSKRFWSSLVLILGGVGALFTGEKTLEHILPEMVVAGIGLINILIAFWGGEEHNQPLGFGKIWDNE